HRQGKIAKRLCGAYLRQAGGPADPGRFSDLVGGAFDDLPEERARLGDLRMLAWRRRRQDLERVAGIIGIWRVDQDHAGDVAGILLGEDARDQAAERVTDQHAWAGLARLDQEQV